MSKAAKSTPRTSSFAGRLNSWHIALRMAWRDIKRYKGRSVLASLLIFLPVFVLAGGLSGITTFDISEKERSAPRYAGVQAFVSFAKEEPAKTVMPASGKKLSANQLPTAAELSKQLGGVPVTVTGYTMFTMSLDRWESVANQTSAETLLTDLSSPINQGKFTLVSGHLPKGPNEFVITDLGGIVGLPQTGKATIGEDSREVKIVGKVRTTLPDVALVGNVEATRRVKGTSVTNALFAIGGDTPLNTTQIAQLESYGADVTPTSQLVAEDVHRDNTPTLQTAFIPITIATMCFIMVVALLAGPAFAASATRQRRALGLLAANGATRAVLRRVVLAQALLLGAMTGLVAAVSGSLLGAVAGYFARIHYSGFKPPVEIHWTWAFAIVIVSAVASMVSAYFPARAAGKTNLLQALRGQVSPRTIRKRMPLAGLLGVFLGSAMLWFAVSWGQGSYDSNKKAVVTTLICVGTPLFFGGAVMAVPYVLRACGALARFLPLTPRLAVRDVSRQRTRATAAVGAVLATVAVLTGGAVFATSLDKQEAKRYQPQIPMGSAALAYWGTSAKAVTNAQQTLPDIKRIAPSAVAYWRAGTNDQAQFRQSCPKQLKGADPMGVALVALDDAGLQQLKLSGTEKKVLNDGGVLVVGQGKTDYNSTVYWVGNFSDPSHIRGGKLTLGRQEVDAKSQAIKQCTPTSFAAATLPYSHVSHLGGLGYGVIVTKLSTLQKHASQVTLAGVWIPASDHIDTRKEHQLQALAGHSFRLTVERGYQSPVSKIVLGLTAIFALIVVLTTVVATLLSDAESQADAATMAVVGAPTGMRRRVVGAQAAATSFIGALIGIAIGMIPGLTLARSATGEIYDNVTQRMIQTRGTYDVPWLALLAMLVVVPLIAAAISMLFARRHPTLSRREA